MSPLRWPLRACALLSLAPDVASEWTLHESMNCWDGVGATSMKGANPAPGDVSTDVCKQMCQEDDACTGIVVHKSQDSGECYMRKEIRIHKCQKSGDFDLWELSGKPRSALTVMSGGMGEKVAPVPQPSLDMSVGEPKKVFTNDEAGYTTFRIPALIRTTGTTVLAFAEGRTSASDSGHIDVVMKRSTDDGQTWGKLVTVAGSLRSTENAARGNPSPVYDEETGQLLLIFCYNNLYVFRQTSDDEGLTWSEAENITHMVKRPGWGWYATGPGHAIQLKNGVHKGRIVVPFNSFFADSLVKTIVHQRGCVLTDVAAECAQYFDESQKSLDVMVEIENPQDPDMKPLRSQWFNDTTRVPEFVLTGDRSGVFYSDDHGATWQLGGMVDSRLGSSECMAAEVEQGLLLSFRVENADTNCRKMALSEDGGQSFGHFFEPEVCIPDPTCQGSLVALDDGRLVTCGPGNPGAREDTTLHVSSSSAAQRQRSTEPFPFRKLGMVNKGSGGYSDITQLESSATGMRRMGVMWELGFGGGCLFSSVELPDVQDTDFVDPEDPWAALV